MIALLFAIAVASADPTQAVMDHVKSAMRDPDSAKFRDIKPSVTGTYCGWVNGKNGFGGYTGFQLFYDTDGKVEIINDEYLRLMDRLSDISAGMLAKIAACRT